MPQQYEERQTAICAQLDALLESAEATLTTLQFDEAKATLNAAYHTINDLVVLYRRRRGKARKELRRLVLLYSLNQRALAGAISAVKGEQAAEPLLVAARRDVTERVAAYPDSVEFQELANKIDSWRLLLNSN